MTARATDVEVAAALAAAASHDVRNLLAVAETSAHLAADHWEDRAFATKHLDKVCSKLRQAQELIDRCLAVAKGDAIAAAPVKLDAVLRDAIGMVAVPERVAVDVDVEAAELLVECEQLLLGRAVANLVENAVQAVAGAGGGRVMIDARAEGGATIVRVSDTGPGIDPALVFAGQSTKPGGTGLGLRVSRAVVSAHGGTLQLVARLDWATTFEICLPPKRAGG